MGPPRRRPGRYVVRLVVAFGDRRVGPPPPPPLARAPPFRGRDEAGADVAGRLLPPPRETGRRPSLVRAVAVTALGKEAGRPEDAALGGGPDTAVVDTDNVADHARLRVGVGIVGRLPPKVGTGTANDAGLTLVAVAFGVAGVAEPGRGVTVAPVGLSLGTVTPVTPTPDTPETAALDARRVTGHAVGRPPRLEEL